MITVSQISQDKKFAYISEYITKKGIKRMKQTAKRNWFETLNKALESENLVNSWDCLRPGIGYNETARYYYKDEVIVIYRDNRGLYERPIHYKTR